MECHPYRVGPLGASLIAVLVFAVSPAAFLNAQAGPAQSTAPPEVTSHEAEPSFSIRVRANEVLVRVVVRDANAKPVTNLRQDDFRIFDDNHPQTIIHFSVETARPQSVPAASATAGAGESSQTPGAPAAAQAITLPTQFMALYFDDIHLEFADLARTRDAAERYLTANLKPGDRAGIFTSSGQHQLDFTDDRAKLHDALNQLSPHPLGARSSADCPQILPYQAYQIVDGEDTNAMTIAQQEAMQCSCSTSIRNTAPGSLGNAGTSAVAAGPTGAPGASQCPQAAPDAIVHDAQIVLQESERDTRYALEGLERLCRRMETLHGQRSTVLISPGFMTITEMPDFERVVDEALRQNVVISTLDARGLYTEGGLGDASEAVDLADGGTLMNTKAQYATQAKSMDSDVLISLADATGGVAFRNNNNFDEGFQRAGAFPEVYYVLTFAPEDFKPDGRFHKIKVTLADNPSRYTVQARKGYFDPNKDEDQASLAKEELETIAFSDNELHDIPVEFHTQFHKSGPASATLTVLTHVDVSRFHFRKVADRNLDNLTVVTILFDQAGDYVAGQERDIEFHLRDSTLARLVQSGITTRSNLAVKPGAYMIREIVRDSEGGEVSALNGSVEIP